MYGCSLAFMTNLLSYLEHVPFPRAFFASIVWLGQLQHCVHIVTGHNVNGAHIWILMCERRAQIPYVFRYYTYIDGANGIGVVYELQSFGNITVEFRDIEYTLDTTGFAFIEYKRYRLCVTFHGSTLTYVDIPRVCERTQSKKQM
jgi:hypothetical protein